LRHNSHAAQNLTFDCIADKVPVPSCCLVAGVCQGAVFGVQFQCPTRTVSVFLVQGTQKHCGCRKTDCRYGWELGLQELDAGVAELERQKRMPNFGNAGAVNNLLSVAATRMEARLKHLTAIERAASLPTPQDFDPGLAPGARIADPAVLFADLVGCKKVCVLPVQSFHCCMARFRCHLSATKLERHEAALFRVYGH
jgi:hypothetical protein